MRIAGERCEAEKPSDARVAVRDVRRLDTGRLGYKAGDRHWIDSESARWPPFDKLDSRDEGSGLQPHTRILAEARTIKSRFFRPPQSFSEQ